jgi:hypothetical protein
MIIFRRYKVRMEGGGENASASGETEACSRTRAVQTLQQTDCLYMQHRVRLAHAYVTNADGILQVGDRDDRNASIGRVSSLLPPSVCPAPRSWSLVECEAITPELATAGATSGPRQRIPTRTKTRARRP